MIGVVTSWGPKGWDEYAWKFVETFGKLWPADVRLHLYWEGERPQGLCRPGVDLLETEPCKGWLRQNEHDQVMKGRVLNEPRRWAEKWQKAGYNFKFDAYKFARKVFAMHHAAKMMVKGKLFWIDADVVTKDTPPRSLFDELLSDDVNLCLLERPGWYPECGFVGMNLNRVGTWHFLGMLEDEYVSGGFREYREWHDSYLIEKVAWKAGSRVKAIPNNSRGQPFDHSVLGKYMTHYKGARKQEIR